MKISIINYPDGKKMEKSLSKILMTIVLVQLSWRQYRSPTHMYLSIFVFAVAISCAVVEEMFHLSSLVGSRLDVFTDAFESARRSKSCWL